MWTSDAVRAAGRTARRLARLAPLALLAAAARDADAQGAVRGELALVERPGAAAADLRGALLWLEPRGGAAAAPAAPRGGSILMRGREFSPRVLPVAVGGSVGFPNDDPFSHNVFSNADAAPFDLGLYRRGVTRAATFPTAGVYPIHCNIHSKMVAFVVAVPDAWIARPDAAGRFAFADVPAGAYVLHAWHERASAPHAQPLVVSPGGAPGVRVTLDARAYVPAPHLNKFGRPYAVLRTDRY